MKRPAIALLTLLIATGCASAARPEVEALQPALVSMTVADLDRSTRWYQDLLGFRPVRALQFPDHQLRIAFLRRGDFQLELIEFAGSVSLDAIRSSFPAVTDRARLQGLGKLAFSVKDLPALAASLEQRGAHFVSRVTTDEATGERWFMILDPDGNWLQFFAR